MTYIGWRTFHDLVVWTRPLICCPELSGMVHAVFLWWEVLNPRSHLTWEQLKIRYCGLPLMRGLEGNLFKYCVLIDLWG